MTQDLTLEVSNLVDLPAGTYTVKEVYIIVEESGRSVLKVEVER